MSARNYVPAMVKWMVEEGTKNTSSGNWIFTSAEIAEAFPVAESSVIEMFGAILTEVYQHEAVAEANLVFKGTELIIFQPDAVGTTFDLTFYTDYCQNISDETKAG